MIDLMTLMAKKGISKFKDKAKDAWANPQHDAKAAVDSMLAERPSAAPDPNRWQQHIKNREFHGRRVK